MAETANFHKKTCANINYKTYTMVVRIDAVSCLPLTQGVQAIRRPFEAFRLLFRQLTLENSLISVTGIWCLIFFSQIKINVHLKDFVLVVESCLQPFVLVEGVVKMPIKILVEVCFIFTINKNLNGWMITFHESWPINKAHKKAQNTNEKV